MDRPEPELPDGVVNVLEAHDLCSENASEAHLGCPKVTRPSLQNRRSSKLVGCSVTNDVGYEASPSRQNGCRFRKTSARGKKGRQP
jgi:hypothetical protein